MMSRHLFRRKPGQNVTISWTGLVTEPEMGPGEELEGGELVTLKHFRVTVTVVEVADGICTLELRTADPCQPMAGRLESDIRLNGDCRRPGNGRSAPDTP